jgi:glycosyltransferase involved in cell wall biosynthesis
MGNPRFLLVASYADSIPVFRGPLLKALTSVGWEVHVAAPGLDAMTDLCAALRANGITPHEIPLRRTGTNPISDIALLFALIRLMHRLRPDAILAYTIKPVVYGMLAASLCGVPRRFALVTGLGYAFTGERSGWMRSVATAMYRFALRHAHKVFFQNPDDERDFRRAGILAKAMPSVVVNGSGVDVDAYAFGGVRPEPPVFLMIGRLLGDKGVREYAEAARRVKAKEPGARFQMVGWIDTNPDAISQSELDAWIAEGTLEFLGKLDDVRPALAGSMAYVLPSYREGTPRTVLEAMAMGRPIITTDAPGCRETVIDGENGFLVPVGSVDALVAAMHRFIDDPTLAARMGRRSRELAEEKYDVRKVNAVMIREMGAVAPGSGVSHAG